MTSGPVRGRSAPVRPDESVDPVTAVLSAHQDGRPLALETSGTTTGTPRRVVRSTESWWRSFEGYSALTGVDGGSRVWVPGPLRATMNLFASVHAVATGARLVRDPSAATHACVTPTQLGMLGPDLPQGTTVVVAGASLAPAQAERARTRGLRPVHYYGAAELSFVAAGTSAADLHPFPGVELDVRGEDGVGEIWVRSAYVCDGYLGPAGSLRADGDGWATVGDVGAFAADVLTVHGRPDAVTTAGATVVLAEVEAALRPRAVAPFTVCGVPHPTMGFLLAAVLTDPDDRAPLQRRARDHLVPSHRPRVWHVVDALPMTAAGKVDRVLLGRLVRDAGVADV